MKNENDNKPNTTLTSSKQENFQQNSPTKSDLIKSYKIPQQEAVDQKSVGKPSRSFDMSIFTRHLKNTSVDKSSRNSSPVFDRSNIDKSSENINASPVSDRSNTSQPSPKSVSDNREFDIIEPVVRPVKQAPTVNQPEPRVFYREPMPNRSCSPLPEESLLKIPRPLKVKRSDIKNPYSLKGPELETGTQPHPFNETEGVIKAGVETGIETIAEQGTKKSEPRYSIGVPIITSPLKDFRSKDLSVVEILALIYFSIFLISTGLVKLGMG